MCRVAEQSLRYRGFSLSTASRKAPIKPVNGTEEKAPERSLLSKAAKFSHAETLFRMGEGRIAKVDIARSQLEQTPGQMKLNGRRS